MFENPTINDYLDAIRWHLDHNFEAASRAATAIQRQASAAGALGNGYTPVRIIEAARNEFEKGVNAALGEMQRASQRTNLDKIAIKTHTMQLLAQHCERVKSAIPKSLWERAPDGAKQRYWAEMNKFDEYLRFAPRQFLTGFMVLNEPEMPNVTNNYSISVQNMTGSAIQQGTDNSAQSATFNSNDARVALDAFELAMNGAKLPDSAIGALRAEVATIRAQLTKPSPSALILAEAGRSIRNVVEGIGAGLLTPSIAATLPALVNALGS